MNIKCIVSGAFLLLGISLTSTAGIVTDSGDITCWVGSGDNSAALILDFHDGETVESFAWGYRWNGVASGADMLIAIAGADSGLSVSHNGDGASDFYINSISYNDGSVAHSGVNGYVDTTYYFWGYYLSGGFAGDTNPGVPGGDAVAVAGGGSALPASWTMSPSGASLDAFGDSGRILEDGSWDAWSFGAMDGATYDHTVAPGSTVNAAIPEPTTVTLMAGSFGGMIWFRRRRKYFFRR